MSLDNVTDEPMNDEVVVQDAFDTLTDRELMLYIARNIANASRVIESLEPVATKFANGPMGKLFGGGLFG